jgi:hypothetical protein
MYIKLPVPVFYTAFGLKDLDAGKTILRAIGTPFTCFHFRAQKSLYFQGPPLPMALEMDLLPSK